MNTEPSPRQTRAQVVKAALWLQNLWANDPHLPAFTWAMLPQLPTWVFAPPEQREKMALLAGGLFAAPALRMSLDAAPIERLRGLIGPAQLDQVLVLSEHLTEIPPWPPDPCSERGALLGWGVALLAASLDIPALQLSVLHAFALPGQWHCSGLPPPMLARRMTQLAWDLSDIRQDTP
jgi:hypothetical protein